jgi:hypothetical protein
MKGAIMINDVEKALGEVAKAMENFNDVTKVAIEHLRDNKPAKNINLSDLEGSANAMKDSSTIYLAWANHLVDKMNGKVTLEE